MKLKKIKKNWLKRNFQHCIEKTRIVQHRHLRQMKINVFVFIFLSASFGVCVYALYCFKPMKNQTKYLLELIKWRLNLHQKNMSYGRTWNLDQWKLFSKNFTPMRVRLWFVYKITETSCCSPLLPGLFKLKRGILPPLTISVLSWWLLIISSQNFSCELSSWRTYSFQNISYLSLWL